MALKFRKKIILAKTEGTYGTDSVPTGAANAILTSNLEISPMEGDVVQRDVDRPTLGNDLGIHVGTFQKVTFDVEFAGSGAAGTAPAYGPLLRACGFAETIIVATDTQYDPVSVNEESATLYVHFDGQKHALIGARGTVSFGLDPKGIPKFKFEFTGLWVDPVSIADPVPDTSAFQVPLAITNANTPTFALHGGSFNLLNWNYDHAVEVVYRNVVGQESVEIVDRAPKGSLTIEAPPLSVKNWFTSVKANSVGSAQIIHGTAAGSIVQFDSAIVQLMQPKYGESDGIRTLAMDMAFIPSSAGDDDIKITVK